jgi:DNA-binding beta-propeller fold protein YncE
MLKRWCRILLGPTFLAASASAEAPPQFQTAWGEAGAGAGQFSGAPEGICVDLAGNVYVADTGNYRIQKFSGDGTPLAQWGTGGFGNGQFRHPRDIAVDASGHIYVADSDNNRIQKLDPTGVFIAKWGRNGGDGSSGSGDGEFNDPWGLDVAPDGTVYVADTFNSRIQVFDTDGTFLARWGGWDVFSQPHDVAVGPDGSVYVLDTGNARVQKLTPGGVLVTSWGSPGSGEGQFWGPRGIKCDATGNVYVGDTFAHRVQKFSADGAFLCLWGTPGTEAGQFQFTWGVAVDGSGRIFVADAGNSRIQRFAPAPIAVVPITWGEFKELMRR